MAMNTYRIADKVIQVKSLHSYVHEYFRDYAFAGTPDFVVETSQADIDFERSKSDTEGYSPQYLESLAVYRKISEIMPMYSTFLMHGSCVSVDGKGCMFTAPSGTGKSTHSALWCRLMGERAIMVNDDKPMIHITGNEAVIYGTPFMGKHNRGNNIHVPLKAICILERSESNHIHEISGDEAYITLLRQTYRPGNTMSLAKTLELLDCLKKLVKFYRLGCNMDIEAAEIAYSTMKGE